MKSVWNIAFSEEKELCKKNIHPAKENYEKSRGSGSGTTTPFWVDNHVWQNFQTYFGLYPTHWKIIMEKYSSVFL